VTTSRAGDGANETTCNGCAGRAAGGRHALSAATGAPRPQGRATCAQPAAGRPGCS